MVGRAKRELVVSEEKVEPGEFYAIGVMMNKEFKFPKSSVCSSRATKSLLAETQLLALSLEDNPNILMAFEVKDYKDRVYNIIVNNDNGKIRYYKQLNKLGMRELSKPMFLSLLKNDKVEWVFVSADAEKLIFADLMVDVI